jgi:putative drug exporter of the RND superfamily
MWVAQTGSYVLLRKPLRTLIVAGCCIAALAVAGIEAESKLHQTSLSISGTESARTGALLRHYFGKSEPFIILLKGPPKDVKEQGQQLVRTLSQDPRATTISPWSREAIGQLRPTQRSAVIFVSFRVGLDEAVKTTVPHLNELLERRITPPVRAVQSGYASVSSAIQEEAARATQRGELIAVPLVLLVLLLVFRSPIAASIPLAFGGATVAGSRGILSIAANWLSIDAFALTVSAMMGLALGIDYTLLMVSRFREELAAGKSSIAAAQATRGTAGRTTAFAGGALFVSMVASALILPGTFLVSLAGAVVVVAGFSVVLGVLVVPSLLALVGDGIDRWSIGLGRKSQGPWSRLIDRVLHRPGLVAAALTVPLLLLALPAVSLSVGPPNPDQLPSTNRARLNAELVNQEVGPGWAAPYVVLAATGRGAITSQTHLEVLRRWERDVARENDVQAVIGPGAIAKRVEPISKFGHSFLAQDRPGSQASKLQQLGSNLGHAAQGVTALRSGIAKATYGAGLLSDGSQNVERGAQAVASGLAAATTGSGGAAKALDRFAAGTRGIRRGQHRAALGARALKYDIRDLIPRLRHSTLFPARRLEQELTDMQNTTPHLESRAKEAEGQLSTALLEFQRMPESPSDPHYASALRSVQAAQEVIAGIGLSGSGDEAGLSTELQILGMNVLRASERAGQVSSGVVGGIAALQEEIPLTRQLADGLDRLEQGGQSLDSGAHRLARSTAALAEGLPRLSQGAAALSGGAEQLVHGTSSLASNLGQAYTLSRPLEPGLTKAATQSASSGVSLQRQSSRLRQLSPGLFRSGYFNLSALDGTPTNQRSRIEQAVDVDRGGQAARILVIPRHEGSVALDNQLRATASELGRDVSGVAGVAGGPAELNDYSHASRSRLPIVIAVVSLVTFLTLVIVLRAIIASALTVLLNLVSVAVAFGVLALVSELPSGAPIGNWGYIDTIGAVAIFAIAFGVSIDYSVFILVRMREEFDRTKDHEASVWIGVQRTGRVITGAALMMVVVFAAFATSSLAIVSQLGTGLTVAILMDATVIRLVLLPALLLLVGERSWWLPASIGRLIGSLRLT